MPGPRRASDRKWEKRTFRCPGKGLTVYAQITVTGLRPLLIRLSHKSRWVSVLAVPLPPGKMSASVLEARRAPGERSTAACCLPAHDSRSWGTAGSQESHARTPPPRRITADALAQVGEHCCAGVCRRCSRNRAISRKEFASDVHPELPSLIGLLLGFKEQRGENRKAKEALESLLLDVGMQAFMCRNSAVTQRLLTERGRGRDHVQ